MDDYTFEQLIDLEQLRQLLEAHHRLSGMACGLMDTQGNSLVSVGWQDICARFHRTHPVSCARCNENAAYINAQLKDSPDGVVESGCANRMVDIAMPIFFDGRHQATFVTGQFFYEDNPPDRAFYIQQAEALGFDKAEYLAALDQVPLFSREHVSGNLMLLRKLVQMLGDTSLKNLRLARETKGREQVEHRVALLSVALNHVREAAFLIDEHARFHYVNEEACRILGYPRETLLTMGVMDVDPDAPTERGPLHWQRLKECKSLMFEGRHRTKGGRIFPVEVHANFIEYDGQQFSLALVRDITERKRTEERLMMREREFRTLTENSPDNIARYDCEGRLLYANPALLNLLGCSLQDRLGRIPVDSPLGESLRGYQDALLRVAATGEDARFEITYDAPAGASQTHWIHMVAELGEDGSPVAVLSVGRDISDIKRAELELQHSRAGLAEAQRIAQLGSWEMAYADGGRLSWSDEMFEIHDIDPKDFDGSHDGILPVVHPEDRNRVIQMRFDAVRGQRDRYQMGYRLQMKDGRIKFVHEQGRNTFDADGRPVRSVGTVQDITHKQEIELQLLQAQKMEAIGTLVGGIAHDFNNKLAAINANLYLAKQTVGQHSTAAGRLESVETLSFEAADMVRQLLTFARKGKIELTPLMLDDFIKEMTRLNHVAIPENIRLSIDYGEQPLPVIGDATQLQQVFLNLLTNARHALTDCEAPHIGISLDGYEPDIAFRRRHPDMQAAAYARVQVRDNGVGIEPEHLDQIFEPFFTTKEVDQGTGLGLAMVYGVIKAHHGVIEVESRPGTGTCFSVFLPIQAAASPHRPVREEAIAQGDGETILLADDDVQLLDAFGELLASINYRVLKARNGHEAITLFREHADDIRLVILDIVMPEMKGPKVAKLIREARPDVKLLYATGYDRLAEKEDLEPEAEVLGKPYTLSRVSRTIRELLNSECCR